MPVLLVVALLDEIPIEKIKNRHHFPLLLFLIIHINAHYDPENYCLSYMCNNSLFNFKGTCEKRDLDKSYAKRCEYKKYCSHELNQCRDDPYDTKIDKLPGENCFEGSDLI